MKHLFIINPVAGKGKTIRYISQIEEIFKEKKEEYYIEITKNEGHATELVKKYIEKDQYRVYSIGGDGTLNEVLNGMVGSNSSLGVIPSGSGNDFVRNICNCEVILNDAINGQEREVDIGRMNDKYFINVASVGIDAEVTYNARKFKKIPFINGGIAYILSIFATVFKYKSSELKIKIDEQEFYTKTLLIAIANGKYYGGGMKVAPEAQIDDGIFEVCLVRHISRIKILRLFPKLIKGEHKSVKEVSFYKGRKIKISSKKEIAVNRDGEVIKLKEVEFEVIPKGIKIVVPQ